MTRLLEVDDVLRAWLAEGAERAPTTHVDAALEEIERTAQRRQPIAAVHAGARPHWAEPLLLAAAAALLFVVAAAVGIQTGLIELPDSSQPDPPVIIDPSPDPAADLETFTADDASFAIRLPRAWGRATGPDRSAMYLADSPMELSIRAGDTNGQVRTCDEGAGAWETCDTITATNLTELAAGIGLTTKEEYGVGNLGPMRTVTTLDGEPARVVKIQAYEHPARGAQFVTYVVAMHDGRPFILRASTTRGDGIDTLDLISGFAFLEISADEDVDTFTAPDGTFEIRLPSGWTSARGPDPSAMYLRAEGMSLSIRASDAEGNLLTCDLPVAPWESCGLIDPADLEELASGIGLDDVGQVWKGPLSSETPLLGGEPGQMLWVVGQAVTPECTCPVTVKYVVAMHRDRPFIVRIQGGGEGVDAVGPLSGFSFIDQPAPDDAGDDTTFTAPDGSFAIRLPVTWRADTGPDPAAMYFSFGPRTLSIRAGDEDGRIRTCDAGAGPWEVCDTITAVTLEQLAAGIGFIQATEHGVPSGTPVQTSASLAGEPAEVMKLDAYEYPARGSEFVEYLVAMHDGRPFILRAWTSNSRSVGITDLAVEFSFRQPGSSIPVTLEPYTNTEAGYSLLLPETWIAAMEEDADGALPDSTSVAFRDPLAESGIALRITVGERGSMTLDDVEDLLSSSGCGGYGELHEQGFLDTDPGRTEGPDRAGNSCLGYPGFRHHVYAIHDGRPIVLGFDYWLFEFGSYSPPRWSLVDTIVDSFEFTDE